MRYSDPEYREMAQAEAAAQEADDWAAAVDAENERGLLEHDPWYARARAVLAERTPDHGQWLQQLLDRIAAECQHRFDECRAETEDALADAAEYAADPYKYYGVSRSDF